MPRILPPACSALEALLSLPVAGRLVLRWVCITSANFSAWYNYTSGSSTFLPLSYSSLPLFVHPLFIPYPFSDWLGPPSFYQNLPSHRYKGFSSVSVFWMISGIWKYCPFLSTHHSFLLRTENSIRSYLLRGFQSWLQIKVVRKVYWKYWFLKLWAILENSYIVEVRGRSRSWKAALQFICSVG